MTIITLIIPWLLGLAVSAALLQDRAKFFGTAEKLALSFIAGWSAHTLVMFLISLAGVPLVFINIALADLALSACLLVLSFRRTDWWLGWRAPQADWLAPASLVLLVLIGLKALFVTWSAFIRPVLDPDIIRCYALGAKTIFLNKTVLVGGAPWGGKPLMPFLAQAWTAIGPNFWNDALLTLPNPLFFVSLLVIFYSALARYFKHWYALLATALLATVPFLVYQAGTAYTDFGQALYYSAATIYLFLFMKEFGQEKEAARGYLLAGALLLGLSVWAKKSGLYYAAIDVSAVALFLWTVREKLVKDDWVALAKSAVLLVLTAAPWLLFNQFSMVKTYSTEAAEVQTVLGTEIVPRTFPILAAFFRNAFLEDNWHGLAILFLAALAFYPRQAVSGPRKFIFLIVVLQLACLFALFRATYLYHFIFDETLLNRLTFHFIPVVLFYCAEVIGAGETVRLSRPEKKD